MKEVLLALSLGNLGKKASLGLNGMWIVARTNPLTLDKIPYEGEPLLSPPPTKDFQSKGNVPKDCQIEL